MTSFAGSLNYQTTFKCFLSCKGIGFTATHRGSPLQTDACRRAKEDSFTSTQPRRSCTCALCSGAPGHQARHGAWDGERSRGRQPSARRNGADADIRVRHGGHFDRSHGFVRTDLLRALGHGAAARGRSFKPLLHAGVRRLCAGSAVAHLSSWIAERCGAGRLSSKVRPTGTAGEQPLHNGAELRCHRRQGH